MTIDETKPLLATDNEVKIELKKATNTDFRRSRNLKTIGNLCIGAGIGAIVGEIFESSVYEMMGVMLDDYLPIPVSMIAALGGLISGLYFNYFENKTSCLSKISVFTQRESSVAKADTRNENRVAVSKTMLP